MRQATCRIAVLLAAVVALDVLVCCQQILGLDEGKPAGAAGTASTAAGSSGTGGASSTAGSSTGGRSAGPDSSGSTASSTTGSGGGSSGSNSVGSTSSASTSSASTSAGAGGADCKGIVTITAANLIDDMEEGSGSIIQQAGRVGSWFTYDDGTDGGVQTPPAGGPCLPVPIPDGGRCGSLHAMHTHGSGFTSYGVGIGFDLNHPAAARMPYDVSAYSGIAFWAKGPQIVEVQIVEQATAPMSQGGTCTANCGDHYFLGVAVSAEWQEVAVPFSMLKQSGWGASATWDPTTVLAVQLAVNPAPTFDYWIDDIGFY